MDGVTGGNIAVAQAAVADTTEAKDRVRVFGIMGAIWGIGFLLGPYIGGKLSNPELVSWFSSSTPFFFAAILSFINVASIYYFFRETNHSLQPKRKIDFFGAIKNIVKARKYESSATFFLLHSYSMPASLSLLHSSRLRFAQIQLHRKRCRQSLRLRRHLYYLYAARHCSGNFQKIS